MLWADTKTLSNLVHISENVESIDYSFSTCWSVETYGILCICAYVCCEQPKIMCVPFTCQYGHCCCLSSSIMSQKSSNLTFIHVQSDIVHSPLSGLLFVIGEKSVEQWLQELTKQFIIQYSKIITPLVAPYFSETGNTCPVRAWNCEIVKFGTDKHGNWFSKYQRTYQLFSLCHLKEFDDYIT